MALIKCEECGAEVSEKAKQCPKCACPIAAVTIEQTGKALKAQGCAAFFLTGLGAVICIACMVNDMTPGIFIGGIMGLGGVVWLIINKVQTWWHHG